MRCETTGLGQSALVLGLYVLFYIRPMLYLNPVCCAMCCWPESAWPHKWRLEINTRISFTWCESKVMAVTDLFMCVSKCLCVSERTTVPMRGSVFSSTLRVQGIKLRLSDSVVSVFIQWALGPAQVYMVYFKGQVLLKSNSKTQKLVIQRNYLTLETNVY